MRRLYRQADRVDPERLGARFTECLAIDVRRQLGRAVIADLAGHKPVLPGIGLPEGIRTALVDDIDARIRALPSGSTQADGVAVAQDAVREYAERWGRELNAHVSAERYRDGREIMASFNEAVRRGCSDALDRLLTGARTQAPDDTVDLDDNLLGRGSR
jgi:hypothetical protein